MKFIAIVCFGFALVAGACTDQTLNPELRNNRGLANGSIELLAPEGDFSFPANLTPTEQIFCPVVINGVGGTFVLDTGFSEYPIISSAFAQKIGLGKESFTTSSFLGNTQIFGPLKFAIGPFSIVQTKVGVVADDTFPENIDGFFGFSVLKYFKLTIDPRSQSVTLSLGTEPREGSTTLLPRRDGKPRCKVELEGKAYVAVLDTGNSSPNRVTNRFDLTVLTATAPQNVIKYVTNSSLVNWSGARSELQALIKLDTVVGQDTNPQTLNYWVTNNLLDESQVNLGMEFFATNVVTIDFYNWAISIEHFTTTSDTIRYSPFEFYQGQVIAMVDRPELTGGVQLGDRILGQKPQIDSELLHSSIGLFLIFQNGQGRRFEVERKWLEF